MFLYRVFKLKPARLHGEIKKGFFITRLTDCIDSQGSHFQHLLYECAFSPPKTKRNKIPALIWPRKRTCFKWNTLYISFLYICIGDGTRVASGVWTFLEFNWLPNSSYKLHWFEKKILCLEMWLAIFDRQLVKRVQHFWPLKRVVPNCGNHSTYRFE
jgi:hypothetical protein